MIEACNTLSAVDCAHQGVAVQAFGGGDMDALPTITQRAVLFSLLHCAPITGVLIAAPSIMQR